MVLHLDYLKMTTLTLTPRGRGKTQLAPVGANPQNLSPILSAPRFLGLEVALSLLAAPPPHTHTAPYTTGVGNVTVVYWDWSLVLC